MCYDVIRSDVALELAWINNMIDFALPYLLQVTALPFHGWSFFYIIIRSSPCQFLVAWIVVVILKTHLHFVLQFIREYTGKIDELIKDKIEAQKETKAKEQEEKDVIAQQVHSYVISFSHA